MSDRRSSHRPGKAPTLTARDPASLRTFLSRLEFFFKREKLPADDDETRVQWAGAGMEGDGEMQAWYDGSEGELIQMEWGAFKAAFLARALPHDFVWDLLAEVRANRQGTQSFATWATAMRTKQAEVGTTALPDLALVRELLFNMDAELRKLLRKSEVLRGTGLHEDELDALGLGRTPTPSIAITAAVTATTATEPAPVVVVSPSVNWLVFERVARDAWDIIAARREAVAAQVSASQRRTQPVVANTVTTSKAPTTASSAPRRTASSTAPHTANLLTLTEREHDYLRLNDGCFKCRRTGVFHGTKDCLTGFATTNVVVPAGWTVSAGIAARAARSAAAAATATAAAPAAPVIATPKPKLEATLHALNLEEEEFDEDVEWQSGSGTSGEDSSDECADLRFPTLPVTLVGSNQRLEANALADSGASSSFLTERLAEALGVRIHKLSKPREVTLAIKGRKTQQLLIKSYAMVPLVLSNGTWSPGLTFFKVAQLADSLDLVLGNPFLYKHRISIHLWPYPQLQCVQDDLKTTFDLLAPVFGPAPAPVVEPAAPTPESVQASVLARIEALDGELAEQAELAKMDRDFRTEFADLFPTILPDVGHINERADIRHHIRLADPALVHNQRGYPVPQKHKAAWRRLLDEHTAAGRIRPSSSPYAAPSFIIPKKDPTVAPRWVNDYRKLNSNTVKDRTPLPLPDEVLSHCAQARVWGKIDMTNSFFQTRMAEEDIEKTAVKTPWGLYEWVVMPMGLCNAPATHQRRVNEALGSLNGEICFVYLDDIIIFADSLQQHAQRLRQVLSALRAAGLYCSPKKTQLATTRCEFLGHVLSRNGLEADPAKIDKVRTWPTPRTVTQLRGFLGLVQYLRKFVLALAEHTAVLTPLVKKGVVDITGLWGREEQHHFEAIKEIVTSLPCLQPIDHSETADPIWVMTDASKVGLGGVLLQGADWMTASPIAYYSRQLIQAERHYPTHEQELLGVVACLKAWRMELLGVRFHVLTDHRSLEYFDTQPHMSKRQSRWMELLSDYDYDVKHIPGEKNTVADALSRYAFTATEPTTIIAGMSETTLSKGIVESIKAGYTADPFCVQVLKNLKSTPGFTLAEGLLRFDGRIVVPTDILLREALLHDAHDVLGHLGARKTYAAVSMSFYWPTLRRDATDYVRSCDGCQRHKSRTTKAAGQLHSLPVPQKPMTDISIDFVGPLPRSAGFDMLMTVSCRLSGYVRLIPCSSTDGARETADHLYDGWHRLFGMPRRIVSDRDKIFVSKFWRALYKRLGTRLQMSTSFHPQTDGKSERTNKTAVQILRGMVERQQTDWVKHLGAAEFALNSTVSDATLKTPFDLVLGYTPQLTAMEGERSDVEGVEDLIADREMQITEARDNLAAAKVRQAEQANAHRGKEPDWKVGDKVMVDSRDRRSRFKTGKGRSAKLFPRHDGPYEIIEASPEQSKYRLKLDEADKSFPVFHTSKLKAYIPNDPQIFPNREPARPEPVVIGGEEEWTIERIVDERKVGRGRRYLVRWAGYESSADTWEPTAGVKDTAALAEWEARES